MSLLSICSRDPLEANKQLTGDALKQCVNEFGEAIARYLETMEAWGVFLEPKIYDEFERCHIGADAEFQRLETDTLDLHPDDRRRNAEYFWHSYRTACQLVRDRMKSLVVIART